MSEEINKATVLLNEGKTVAIPTETVYGLAANAFDENAVRQIFEIKGRPLFNPLIVHINSINYLEKVAENIPPKALLLAKRFWPGPLTLILPKKEIIPDIVTAGKTTVGVRVPSHPITLQLLNHLNFPLAAPSANPFGYISPTKAQHVKTQLGDKIDFILDGGSCEKGIESTIIGFENEAPVLYRVGAISIEEIENYVGKITVKNNAASKPDAPGMLNKHYSPKTKFIVSEDIAKSIQENNNAAFLLFSNIEMDSNIQFIRLTDTDNLDEAAQNLYSAMHQLDAMNIDLIIAEKFPESGIGISLNDRLYRAQEKIFDSVTQNEINTITQNKSK